MSTTEVLKAKLHTLIENISDENVLQAHAVLLQKEISQSENWDLLSDELKNELQLSELEFQNGEFEEASIVLNRLKKEHGL